MSYVKTEWDNGDIITAEKLNNAEIGIEEINMSYEKQTWSNGDIITADKLNHMEDGIGGGGSEYYHIKMNGETYYLDKTWQEIHDALQEYGVGKVFIVDVENHIVQVVARTKYDGHGGYSVGVYDNGNKSDMYFTDDANGYPLED